MINCITGIGGTMAGNVTFIIGNGLDVSLELNTSYRDFYKFVKENNLHPDNSIYHAIARENPEYWADFELGLGRHTNKIESVSEKDRTTWSEKLNDELDEIKKDLMLYVRKQNSAADKHIPHINFDRSAFYAGLETGQISNLLRQFPSNQVAAFRFITLNYTDVLERLLPTPGKSVLGKDFIVAAPIHHIHGSIKRRISLGVNDESQISSFIDASEKDYLIKPELIRRMNDGRLETLSQMISYTNIMVLFGVSIGATDKYIWSMIIDWLGQSSDNLLIIHHFERGLDVSDLTERETLRMEDRVKDKFLSYSNLTDRQKNTVKLRIYIIPNTARLFAINNS